MAAARSMPHLPHEILLAIVRTYRSERDLVFLWTILRNVNHLFREMVDEWVRQRHLHTMSILPTPSMMNAPVSEPGLGYLCLFDRLAHSNPSRAVFSIAPKSGTPSQRCVTKALTWARLRYPISNCEWKGSGDDETGETFTIHADQYVHPPTFVILRRLANDTEIVDWTVDEEAMELELDWRATIGKLVWEEKLRGALTKKWLARARAKRIEAQSKGRTPTMAIMQIAFETRGARDESGNASRTKRIQRQKREHQVQPNRDATAPSAPPADDWTPGRGDIAGFEGVEMLTQSTNCFEYSDDNE